MTEQVLRIEGLTKSFGGLIAVDNVDFTFVPGQLHAIIGPNGAGKTTFFNLVSGILHADHGRVFLRGKDITGLSPHRISKLGIARTLQIKSVFDGLTVFDNIWIAAHSRERFLNPLRPARSFTRTAEKVESLLSELGIDRYRDELAGNLSYGDVALVEMAIALATEPILLLLDEPVAGMSQDETQKMVALIKELSRSVNVILVEHDMEVVFDIADIITVMNNGSILTQGPPDQIAKDPQVQEAYLGTPEETEA